VWSCRGASRSGDTTDSARSCLTGIFICDSYFFGRRNANEHCCEEDPRNVLTISRRCRNSRRNTHGAGRCASSGRLYVSPTDRQHILGVFFAAVLVAFLLPKKYESQMKILVRHERAESVVSPNEKRPCSSTRSERGRAAIRSRITQIKGFTHQSGHSLPTSRISGAPSGMGFGAKYG